LISDPLLIWNYGVAGVLSTLGAIGFWWMFHGLDKEEDSLNNLQRSEFGTKGRVVPTKGDE